MHRRWIVVVLSLAAGLLTGCPNDFGAIGPGGGNNTPPEDPYWCCDPDDPTGCVCEGYWHCTEGFDSSKHCIQQNPELPDDGSQGGWDCQYNGDLIICSGSAGDHPDAGQDGVWDCTTNGDAIECSRQSEDGDVPDDGGGSGWDCTYADGGDARVCDQPGSGSPDDGWDCETAADGTTVCRNDSPEQPDDGNWDCYRVDGQDYCVGDHLPDGGNQGEWDCQENGEMIQCENGSGQVPDDGGGADWDCAWGESFIECESGDGGVDEPGGSCECVVGAQRYCDEPTFCNWGSQECEENNGERRWSRCNETAILSGCQPGGADAQDYEWHYQGGFWDGQVFDPNNDGVLVMPPDNWYNPAAEDCALRKGFCVQDMWDLDNDGDNQESTGDCADIQVCQ